MVQTGNPIGQGRRRREGAKTETTAKVRLVSWQKGTRSTQVCDLSDVPAQLHFAPQTLIFVEGQRVLDIREAEHLLQLALGGGQLDVEVFVIDRGMFAGG